MCWRRMCSVPDHRRIWPRSLAGRTTLIVLSALFVVQAFGLFIHALDRVALQSMDQARNAGLRIAQIERAVVLAPREERTALLAQMRQDNGTDAALSGAPDLDPALLPPFPLAHFVFESMHLVPLPSAQRPTTVLLHPEPGALLASLHLVDGPWLNIRVRMPPPHPWHPADLLLWFCFLTLAAAGLILWSLQRLTAPLRTLALAADSLGRDVNAPALPETGPDEVATAARAFNNMAERIRRFVGDRTLLLAAIGHDLRTPITRLKLRAEFLDDEDQRLKFLADLDELETMVSATLAFGRDASSTEPITPLDLPELLRTVLDEAGDAWPDAAPRLNYDGPAHLVVHARLVALKRALSNLVGNAVKYGGEACISLSGPQHGQFRITVEDAGPGIEPDEISRVFEPFYRVERSRNRDTGGTGLGLSIARNILRGLGGDVTLANRAEGGLRATVTLPA
jgi:signal transduction histidine kinase